MSIQYFIAMRFIAEQGTFEDTYIITYIVNGLQLHCNIVLLSMREKMMGYQIEQVEDVGSFKSSCTSAAGVGVKSTHADQ